MKEVIIMEAGHYRIYNVLDTYGRSYLLSERKEGYSENSGTNRFLMPIQSLIKSKYGDYYRIADWFKKIADHKQQLFLYLKEI